MLRCAVFTADVDARETLALALEHHPDLLLLRSFDHFVSAEVLLDYIRAHSPQVLFFDISRGRDQLLEAAQLLRNTPHVHLVGVDRDLDAEALLELMSAGVREFLRFPFDSEKFAAAFTRIQALIASAPSESEATDLLFSVLPAKPGVGASTVALHAALELSQRPNSKVLFADFDLNCGLSRFLLKIANPLGIRDAVARIAEMDDGLWSEIRSKVDDLDVLATGLIDSNMDLEPARIRSLFEFARRRYRIVFADLSGIVEAFSVDILQQSRKVLLVVEPDLAAVHHAREKIRFLDSLELQDRTSLVINRWHKNAPLTIADIESVLGIAADATLSDAPEQIHKSIMRGGALDPASTFYREIAELANWLATESGVKRTVKPKRKVEYFSILPSRYSLSR